MRTDDRLTDYIVEQVVRLVKTPRYVSATRCPWQKYLWGQTFITSNFFRTRAGR